MQKRTWGEAGSPEQGSPVDGDKSDIHGPEKLSLSLSGVGSGAGVGRTIPGHKRWCDGTCGGECGGGDV